MNRLKLTRRQRCYVTTLLDLYWQSHEEVHHTDVAARLGVSAVTAYEMLRLLEDHGFVVSNYVLSGGGPGRTSIVFRPTDRAFAAITELAGDISDQNWENAQERLLAALEEGRGGDYTDVLEAMLQRLEQPRVPLLYAADMLTAVVLLFYQVAGGTVGKLLDQLRSVGLSDEHNLSVVNGLLLGLSLVERANRTIVTRLLGKADALGQALARLSPDQRRQLVEFVREVVRALQREEGTKSGNRPRPWHGSHRDIGEVDRYETLGSVD